MGLAYQTATHGLPGCGYQTAGHGLPGCMALTCSPPPRFPSPRRYLSVAPSLSSAEKWSCAARSATSCSACLRCRWLISKIFQDLPNLTRSHKISQDDLPWPPLISLLPRPSLTSPPRTSSAIAAPPKCLTYSAGQRLRGREGRLDPTWPRTARAYRRTRCAATHRSCLHG